MSSITIEELKKLPAESYQIIDVRDEIEISHGAVKGLWPVSQRKLWRIRK